MKNKHIELEALRGIAAIVVVIGHFLNAFAPNVVGIFSTDANLLFGTPAFALINADAAVTFFFVLSGFVLSVSLMRSGNLAAGALTAIKRWPRLAVPVLAVNLISGALMALGLYGTAKVSVETQSRWLGNHFGWEPEGFRDIINAAYEGSFGTFLTISGSYNSSLWTMYFEFFGSLLSLALAALFLLLRIRHFVALLIVAWIIATCLSPRFGCFVAGVGLAAQYLRFPDFHWRGASALILGCFLIYLLGFQIRIALNNEAVGWYAFFDPVARQFPVQTRVVIHTLASYGLIFLTLTHPRARSLLATRVGAILGVLSFPIYLTHIIVLCSIGMVVFSSIDSDYPTKCSVAAAITGICVIIFALPIAALDQWWLKRLRLLSKEQP